MIYKIMTLLWTGLFATFFIPAADGCAGSVYDYHFTSLYGKKMPLSDYQGKVILLVNTASKCGFTPQYKNLQALYQRYQEQGLVVIAVPSGDFGDQEFSDSLAIENFTQAHYAIRFPITERNHVKGTSAHPFYQWAKKELGYQAVPKWNFHKLLVDRQGKLVAAFNSLQDPLSDAVVERIEVELQKPQ
ncbi:MAG: glutathione peroxidase [Legionellaceae bacterium]|nr:glutathione peroxidase [Legionellaceae bacterium]